MKHVSCIKCGCEVFYQTQAIKVAQDDFRVWNSGVQLKVDVSTVPLLVCLECNHIMLPSVSFFGKNSLDPEVKAYGEVYNAIKAHNERLDVQTS